MSQKRNTTTSTSWIKCINIEFNRGNDPSWWKYFPPRLHWLEQPTPSHSEFYVGSLHGSKLILVSFFKKLNAFLFIRLHFSGVISFHFTHTTCKRHNVTLTSMTHEDVVLLKENVSISSFYVSRTSLGLLMLYGHWNAWAILLVDFSPDKLCQWYDASYVSWYAASDFNSGNGFFLEYTDCSLCPHWVVCWIFCNL